MLTSAGPRWDLWYVATTYVRDHGIAKIPEGERDAVIATLEEVMLVSQSCHIYRNCLTKRLKVDELHDYCSWLTAEKADQILASGLACLSDSELALLALAPLQLYNVGQLVQETCPNAWAAAMTRVYEDYSTSLPQELRQATVGRESLTDESFEDSNVEDAETADIFALEDAGSDDSETVEWNFTIPADDASHVEYLRGDAQRFNAELVISLSWHSNTSLLLVAFFGDLKPGKQVARSIRWGDSRTAANSARPVQPSEADLLHSSWKVVLHDEASPRVGQVLLAEYADGGRDVHVLIECPL